MIALVDEGLPSFFQLPEVDVILSAHRFVWRPTFRFKFRGVQSVIFFNHPAYLRAMWPRPAPFPIFNCDYI